VLAAIPQLQVSDIAEAEICCGSAGIYNLVQPETAQELGRRKAGHLEAVAPDAVATANAGCLLQIRRFLDAGVPVVHPVQLVDASIRGVDPFPALAVSRGSWSMGFVIQMAARNAAGRPRTGCTWPARQRSRRSSGREDRDQDPRDTA
jgi:Cysteine-rich domain